MGFDVLVEALSKITLGNPYLYAAISTNILAGATGSASGGMGIALAALSEQYIAMGGNPALLHRVVAVASGGLDALPHNGAVVTLLIITGLTHKKAYKDIFMVAVVIPFLIGMIAVVLATTGLIS